MHSISKMSIHNNSCKAIYRSDHMYQYNALVAMVMILSQKPST